MTNKKQHLLELVIYEEAQEIARWRNWSVNFTPSIMSSRFKEGGETREAEAAFILMEREEEHRGKGDPFFLQNGKNKRKPRQQLQLLID